VLTLLPFAVVEAGRHSARNICLRLEPTDDPANLEKTRNISSHHLTIRYLGDSVELIDPGSTNGIFIGKERVPAGQPRRIEPGLTVSVAEVLELEFQPILRRDAVPDKDGVLPAAREKATDPNWLQQNLIGVDKPGQVAYLRVRRKNNATEQEYVLLFHAGVIGSDPEALLSLPVGNQAPLRRVAAFDFGPDLPIHPPARVLVRAGQICIERTGAEPVTLAGKPLEQNQVAPLMPPCAMTVGTTTFRVEP
jgi:pSer/pThr/pTyr-binding forkhead associated (FHA) protein